jgi:hypothetical protein
MPTDDSYPRFDSGFRRRRSISEGGVAMSRRLVRFHLLALCLVAIATSMAAQEQPTPWATYAADVDARVTRFVAEAELFRLSDEHLGIIKSIAYQEAAAFLCPGIATDSGRRIDILSGIVPMQDEQLRDASLESVVLRSEVMFALGTHFGAFVAVGMADSLAFCARAEQDRRDATLPARIWLSPE